MILKKILKDISNTLIEDNSNLKDGPMGHGFNKCEYMYSIFKKLFDIEIFNDCIKCEKNRLFSI